MRLRPYIPGRDFDEIRSWITDERAHAMWCAGRFAFPLEEKNFSAVLRDIGERFGDCAYAATADDGKITGFFCYSVNPATGQGMLKFVIVDPAQRGKGLGKAMLRMAADYAFASTGADTVCLNVFRENLPALKCYEHAGFTAEKTDADAFAFRDESWSRCRMAMRRADRSVHVRGPWTVLYNALTAEQYIELWESVWGNGPTPEQTALGLQHTLFRVSVFDGDRIVAMARMIGDLGLDYYIKDVIVRPEYQRRGIGKLLIGALLDFIRRNGVKGTRVFTELCAMPDKIPFYAQFGFSANEAQRLRIMLPVE